jgi:hypothetical protein
MSVSILPFGYYIVDNTTGAFVVDVRSKKVSYMLQIMENWSYIYRQGMDHYPKFCKMIHENGGSMPEPFRCWLWCMVAGMLDIRAMNPKLFHKSLDTYERSVLVKYASVDASIRLDLHRTYPEFPLFQQRRGIDNMAEVLQALAVVHPDVGYCQGMNFVAGALLQCGLRTEDAFWVFHSLLSSPKHLQGYYDGSLRQVRVEVGILELLIGKKFRKYSQHVAKHGVQWGIVAPPWFIGLFLNIFPWESSCRVFEMFMIYGRAFMFSFCLAVVETNKSMFFMCSFLVFLVFVCVWQNITYRCFFLV